MAQYDELIERLRDFLEHEKQTHLTSSNEAEAAEIDDLLADLTDLQAQVAQERAASVAWLRATVLKFEAEGDIAKPLALAFTRAAEAFERGDHVS